MVSGYYMRWSGNGLLGRGEWLAGICGGGSSEEGVSAEDTM